MGTRPSRLVHVSGVPMGTKLRISFGFGARILWLQTHANVAMLPTHSGYRDSGFLEPTPNGTIH